MASSPVPAVIIQNPVEIKGPSSTGTRYKLPRTVGPQMINRILPWIENFWHEKKRFPNDSEFLTRYEIDAAGLRNLFSSSLFRRALSERGISKEPNLLSPEQVATINVITNFADGRSQEAKLASLGVSVEQLNGWYVQEEFSRRLHAHADEVLDKLYPTAMASFAKQVKDGDMRAIKMYFEVTGRIQTPETINVQRTLQTVIEAVQRHVKDPKILQAISADIGLTRAIEQ